MAVERFLYNLTRPTDQRHQPVPKKRDSSSVGCLPAYLAPALGDKKGGKMKVILPGIGWVDSSYDDRSVSRGDEFFNKYRSDSG